jgi:hypothetical protein
MTRLWLKKKKLKKRLKNSKQNRWLKRNYKPTIRSVKLYQINLTVGWQARTEAKTIKMMN